MATVNRQTIAAVFERAVAHCEQHANLQHQSADALLAMFSQRKYIRVPDAGYGPGWMNHHWQEYHTQVTVLGLSSLMSAQVRQKDTADRYPAGNIESLSLAAMTFGLAWSNLAVQWCGNLSTVLREPYRVVHPGGVAVFTTLVQGSLPEPHQVWRAMDECPHANRLLLPDEIEQSLNAMYHQHYIQPVTLWFDDVFNAMRSLKGIDATHLHGGYDPRILTRSQLWRLQLAWSQQRRQYPPTHHLLLRMTARE